MRENEEEVIRKHWAAHHSAMCKCYTPAGERYIAEYKGKFGEGYMIFDHYNSKYSYVTYWV